MNIRHRITLLENGLSAAFAVDGGDGLTKPKGDAVIATFKKLAGA